MQTLTAMFVETRWRQWRSRLGHLWRKAMPPSAVRMGLSAKVLARAIGWSEAAAELLRRAVPLHDVGKIAIPDAILFKPGPLTPEEWKVTRTHPFLGERILAGSPTPLHRLAAEVAAHHHERWDGSGYPRGLRGEAIPLSARIVSLVDQYDALRCRRSYKPPIDHATVCQILLNGDGRIFPTHFQPELLRAFTRVAGLFAAIYSGISCLSLA